MTSPNSVIQHRRALRALHAGLSARPTPEDVSVQIVELRGESLSASEKALLPKKRWHSQMADTWDRPVSLQGQCDALNAVLDRNWPGVAQPIDGNDPASIVVLLTVARDLIGMKQGETSYKSDRLDRKERKAQKRTRPGLATLSRRQYDKLFRITARLEKESAELIDQLELSDLARFAKIGFAAEVPYRAFKQTDDTAAFVAYYTANLGRRSIFTSGKQARAMDQASEMLLKRLDRDPKTSWFAVAHVFPRWDVLARCTLEERVILLDKARVVMLETATRLSRCVTPTINLEEMIVRRGDDSSTWNALAGSWNKARDMWTAAGWSVDPGIMEAFAPGKVLRLMAADVAAWHRRSTGGLDPDTKVWAALPRPWNVMLGVDTCTRQQVFEACINAGVDSEKSGWTKPRPRTAVDEVYATPELVHGVVISHPQLAKLLRKAGYFGGSSKASKLKEVAPVIHEAALDERALHHAAFGPKVGVAATVGYDEGDEGDL